MKIKEIC